MNVRVGLLALLLAIFAAMWSGDQKQPRGTAASRIEAAAIAAGAGMSPDPDEDDASLAAEEGEESDLASAQDSSPSAESMARVEPTGESTEAAGLTNQNTNPELANIPLPADLTVGEYRVVSNRGDVQSLVIDEEEAGRLSLRNDMLPRASYQIQQNGVHWHFIRLDRVSGDDMVRKGTPIRSAPLCVTQRIELNISFGELFASSPRSAAARPAGMNRSADSGLMGELGDRTLRILREMFAGKKVQAPVRVTTQKGGAERR